MKVVIADTSPLNYLILIDSVDILPRLYGTIVVPEEVLSELLDPGTPAKVIQWIHNCPEWLSIHAAPNTRDAALSQLDPGERAAILLAQQYGRDALLLIDDAAGRIEASRRSIANVGTVVLGNWISDRLGDEGEGKLMRRRKSRQCSSPNAA